MTDRLRIGLLAYPRMTQLDLTGPYEVLARLPRAEVHVLWKARGPVASELGLAVTATTALAEAPPLDALCVPGGPGVNVLLDDDVVLDFLAAQAQGARFVASICTGALALGAAGLLRGRRATTHWLSLDLLPLFGARPVRGRVVADGSVVTGAGVTAGIDLGLSLAAILAGERTATEIALLLEYAPAPPFPGAPEDADAEIVRAVSVARCPLQAERRRRCERAVARRATRH